MEVVRATKKPMNQLILHCSRHTPTLHSGCGFELDLEDHSTSVLLGHECYPFKVTLPVPFIGGTAENETTIDKSVFNGIDPAFDLVYRKNKYHQRYQTVLEGCRGVRLPDLDKNLARSGDEPLVGVHPNIASLAELISKDPDPYFNAEYNSYYENTVAVCNVQDTDFIIHHAPYGAKKLNIVKHTKMSHEVQCDIDRGMDTSQPIYLVQSHRDTILIRLKNQCVIFRLISDDSLRMKLLCLNETKTSFITSCLNPYKNEYVALTPDGLLTTYDINKALVKHEDNLSFLENEDFWGRVHYRDENMLMFCDRKSIHALDLRTPIKRSTVLQWDANAVTDECDSIHSFAKGPSLDYVCTNHFLLAFDARKGWHQRWAHGLSSFPSVLASCSDETSDSLFIGCQMGGGVVNVFNAHSADFKFDYVKAPPFQLPSLVETLHQSRLKGHCLLPLMKSRFTMSLTGLSAIRNASTVDIFLCNSIGDVFTQQMDLSNKFDSFVPELDKSDITRLKAWESQCLNQFLNNKSAYSATSVNDFRKYAKFFESPNLKNRDVESEVEIQNVQPWVWSKHDLESCCDFLAPKLLSCWDVDDDDWANNFSGKPSVKQDDVSGSSDDSIDINQRIQCWLNQSTLAESDDDTNN